MDFVTVSSTMPPELIPRPRRAIHDQLHINQEDRNYKHPIVAYLEQDSRWSDLSRSRYLQLCVLETAMHIHLMTKEEVVSTMKKLDSEIPFSPYLSSMEGTLMEHHEEMTEIALEDAIVLEGSHFIPYFFSQIDLAERLLGRKIEKDRKIAWKADKGFVNPLADVAIELCVEAIEHVPPPNIY